MFEKFREADHLPETKAEFIELVENFLEGEEEGCDCMAVYFKLPNLEANEVIINPKINVANKLEYYTAMYNDKLQLNANPAVQIVGVSFL